MTGTDPEPQRQRIDWLRVSAGALAAVSSAVLLSTLGAAGTMIGAALGSVIVSVATSLYSSGLAASRKRVAEAQTLAMRRVGVAQAEVRRASRRTASSEAHLHHADAELSAAKAELDDAEGSATPTWAERLRALPWKRVAVFAAGFFIAAIVLITAFELITGKPVSSYTGGTSGGGTSFSRFDNGTSTPTTPSPSTPLPSTATTPTTTVAPSESASPSASPSAVTSATPSSTAPTPTAGASATSGGAALP